MQLQDRRRPYDMQERLQHPAYAKRPGLAWPEPLLISVCCLLRSVERGQHLIDVAVHGHVGPELLDSAVLADDDGGPLDAHEGAAVAVALLPDTIALGDLVVWVG